MKGELERIREEIENWVSLIGKKRTEERLGIRIFNFDLEKPKRFPVKYE